MLRCLIALAVTASLVAAETPNPSVQLSLGSDDTVTLTNSTEAPIEFSGYGPTSPLYGMDCLREDGWQEQPVGWCGTGLATQTLAPGQQTTFQVHSPNEPVNWRISLSYQVSGTKAWLSVHSNPRHPIADTTD